MEKLYDVRKISDLKDMLSQSRGLFAEKSAFIYKGEKKQLSEISYRSFSDDVEAFGTALFGLKLENSFVAVLGENRYEWCVTYLSVVNGVGVVVPLDKELPATEIVNLLNRSGAAAVIFSGTYRERIKSIISGVPAVRYFIDMDINEDQDGLKSFKKLLNDGKSMISNGDNSYSNKKIDPDKLSMLLYTSGTTDLAKGVMLSHRNICSNIVSVSSTVHIGKEDVVLSVLPLHHTYECSLGFLCMIYNGGAISFCEGLKRFQSNLIETAPTVMVTVPLILENIYKKIQSKLDKSRLLRIKLKIGRESTKAIYTIFGLDIRRIVFKSVHDNLGGRMRLIITGAAAVKPEVSKFFGDMGIRVLQGYGLTECSPLVAGNRDSRYEDGAAGLPIPGVEVKILGPDDFGIGEIIVKGENVMLGYHNNEAATKSCMKDGWFHTGDLGFFNKKGFLYITGRLKNVIVTKNGKNVFPEEVETYINRSPFVKESLVWGKFDKQTGNMLVCAQILPNLEAIQEKLKGMSDSGQEIMKLISQAVKNANMDMPFYKHIREFSIRENEFVKTTTQKIKRYVENAIMVNLNNNA